VIPLEKTLAILAALVSYAWRCPLVGLLLMIGVSAVLFWRACTPRQLHRWVVRKGHARVVGVHCLAPHGPINASKGLTSCAPKVPICAPSVMAPRSPLYRNNTTWRGLTIDLERGSA